MIVLHDDLKRQLASIIADGLKGMGITTSMEAEYALLGAPPNLKMGHYAYPCFGLAKQLRKAPPLIARELIGHLPKSNLVAAAKVVGPYLNFFINPQEMGALVGDTILSGEFFKKTLTKDTLRTMVEYSQPNTHKELHVGHMRNLALGDALIRMHEYCGFDIVSSTFPGDVGTHVAKCLWYMKYHNTEAAPETEKGAWLGRMYAKGNLKLDAEKDTPQNETNRQQLSAILTQLEEEKGEFYELWKETREWSIALMKQVYDWAGVTFDKWYWESEVDVPSVNFIKSLYEKGALTESRGAIGMDLSEDKLGFCVLLKSDGHGLYATKDVELARRKFEDYSIEKSIYIVDKRQAHHFAQVFKVLEKIGFEQAKDCFHLKYDYVDLPDGAMSSRKGNVVPIMALIRQMEHMVKTEYLAKYEGDWSQEEIELVAKQIAAGAIKYGMIRIAPSRKIVFQMKEWLSLNGESGPYIQYTGARINSLLNKAGSLDDSTIDWGLLKAPQEIAVLLHLANFNNVMVAETLGYRTNGICSYLYDLAKAYNSFYGALSVLKAESEALKNARLALSKAVVETLKVGLGTLNIQVPKRM